VLHPSQLSPSITHQHLSVPHLLYDTHHNSTLSLSLSRHPRRLDKQVKGGWTFVDSESEEEVELERYREQDDDVFGCITGADPHCTNNTGAHGGVWEEGEDGGAGGERQVDAAVRR
jgi:hypothetical protein